MSPSCQRAPQVRSDTPTDPAPADASGRLQRLSPESHIGQRAAVADPSVLIYQKKGIDITSELVKRYNAKHK